MSWETYLDQLKALGVEIGALYGKNGAMCAAHPYLTCSPNEIAVIMDALTSRNESIYSTGVCFAGKRWTVILRDDDSEVLVLKGKDDNIKQSLVIAPSGMAVVCGVNETEDISAGVIRNGVERVRDYLKAVKY